MGFDIKKVGAAVNQKRQFNIDNVGKEVRKKEREQELENAGIVSDPFGARAKEERGLTGTHDKIVTPQSLSREAEVLKSRGNELSGKAKAGTLTAGEAASYDKSVRKYNDNAAYLNNSLNKDFSAKALDSERRTIYGGMEEAAKHSSLLPAIPGTADPKESASSLPGSANGAWWVNPGLQSAADVQAERQAINEDYRALKEKFIRGEATNADFDAFTRRRVAFSKNAPGIFDRELSARIGKNSEYTGAEYGSFENGEISGIAKKSVDELYRNTYEAFLAGQADSTAFDTLAAAVSNYSGKERASILDGLYVTEAERELQAAKRAYSGVLEANKNITYGMPEYDMAQQAKNAAKERVMKAKQKKSAAFNTYTEYKDADDYNRLMREYGYATGAADFAEKSAYKTTKNGKAPKPSATGGYAETGFDDVNYDYINKNADAVNIANANDLANFGLSAAFVGTDKTEMNADEIALYNYLYATEGKAAANAFVDKLKGVLNNRARQSLEASFADYAKDHPVSSSAFSTLIAPVKGLGYIGQAADYAADGKIDQNAPYNKFSFAQKAIRSSVNQTVEKNWGAVGSFAYNTGMSMADFLFTSFVSSGIGAGVAGAEKAAKVASNLSLAIMGSGAAADATIDAKDRGLSDNQSFALGTIAGIAEIVTEKVSIENLFSPNWDENAWRYFIKNVIAEGSEEGASDVINLVADMLISGDQNEWQQSIYKYMDLGYSASEAFGRTAADQFGQIGLDMLGGAVSGGVMAGGRIGFGFGKAAVKTAVEQNNIYRATGKMLRRIGGNNTFDNLAKQAFENGENSKSYEFAAKLQDKAAHGKTITDRELGKLSELSKADIIRSAAARKAASDTADSAKVSENADSEKQGAVREQPEAVTESPESVAENPKTVSESPESVSGQAETKNTVPADAETVNEDSNGNPDISENAAEASGISDDAGEDYDLSNEESEELGELEDAEPFPHAEDSEDEVRDRLWEKASGIPSGEEKDSRLFFEAGISEGDIDEEAAGVIRRISALTDLNIYFYREAAENGTISNGYYDASDNSIHVNLRSNDPVSQIISHELTHSLENTKSYTALQKTVFDYISRTEGKTALADERARLAEVYRRNGKAHSNAAEVDADILASFVGRKLLTDENAIRYVVGYHRSLGVWMREQITRLKAALGSKSAKTQAFLDKAARLYHEALTESKNAVRSENSGKDSKYSVTQNYDFTKSFAEQVDDFINGNSNRDFFIVSGTPEVFQNVGFNALPVTIDKKHVDYVVNGTKNDDHVFSKLTIKDLPKLIKKPVAIFDSSSRPGRVIALVTEKSKSGKQVIVPIEVDASLNSNSLIMDTNLITSSYGHTSALNQLLSAVSNEISGITNLYYWNKKEAVALMHNAGLQLPGNLPKDGFMHSIRESDSNVNTKLENVTHSQQFKRWFGDWVNKPYSASKVVDEDGKPLVVYHGTDADFTVFDRTKGRSSMDIQGMFFSPWELDAQGYGKKVGAYYINLKNPADESTAYKALNMFKGQNNAGIKARDYLIKLGYDGVNNSGEEYIAFYPEQIKSATDNIGTFDGSNPDIRYSVSADSGTDIDVNTEVRRELEREASSEYDRLLQEEYDKRQVLYNNDEGKSVKREDLKKVDKEYLERTERTLLKNLRKALGVPYGVSRDSLSGMVRTISDEYLEKGNISQKTVDTLFERAYDNGRVIDTDYYDEYKHVKDYFRTKAIGVNDRIKSDFADWNAFRQSTMGTLRLVNISESSPNSGIYTVEDAWRDFSEIAPALANKNISADADMLKALFEIVHGIQKVEYRLSDADTDEQKAWEKRDFENAVYDSIRDFRTVRTRAAEVAKPEAKFDPEAYANMSAEDKGQIAASLIKASDAATAAKRNMEKVSRKFLLTGDEELLVGQLLKRQITFSAIDGDRYNLKNIKAVYEARSAYEANAAVLSEFAKRHKAMLIAEADSVLSNMVDTHDKAGINYSTETAERNIRDTFGDNATSEKIIDTYFRPVHKNEAAKTRMMNEYIARVKELKLSNKLSGSDKKAGRVSESAAVQILGEAQGNIEFLENQKKRGKALAERDGKTLEGWKGVISDLWMKNPQLDKPKIEAAVTEFRKIYNELIGEINRVRVLNGYPAISYRAGYFPHFSRNESIDGIMDKITALLGGSTEVTELPTEIAGRTGVFKPGIRWFGAALERQGIGTDYDALYGFARYLDGAADIIYHTDDIQRLRALASQVRYRTTDESIQAQIDDIRRDSALNDDAKEDKIKKLYDKGGYALSGFVNWLDEYTNILAGKKSELDRKIESAVGRKFYNFSKAIEGRVGANMVGGNFASALTNFIPITQAGGSVGSLDLLSGMWDTIKSYKADDGFADRSDFLTNRFGVDALTQTAMQKISSAAGVPMEFIDSFTSNTLVRARYNQNLRSGLSEEAALREADEWAAGLMAGRSKGEMPTIYHSRNLLLKPFTMFQLEVKNQYSYLFKDLPRDFKNRDKNLAKLIAAYFKIFLGAYIFNDLYEKLVGRRSALDPLGIMNDTVGDITGYKLPNVIDGIGDLISGNAFFDETEKAGNAYEVVGGLTSDIADELPFIGGVLGGGRTPINSAFPDMEKMGKAIFNNEWSTKKRVNTALSELGKSVGANVIAPVAGGQIRKIIQGVNAAVSGGSYTLDADGNKILQYPVISENGLELAGNIAKGALFGKSSFETAGDWVDSGFKSFSAKATALYDGLCDSGESKKAAFALISNLRNAEKTDEESRSAVQRDMIRHSALTGAGKALAYAVTGASEKEQELISALDDAGADMGAVADALMDIKDINGSKALKGAEKSNAKRSVLLQMGLTDEEKHRIYTTVISDSKESEIAEFGAAGMSFDTFLKIQNEYSEIGERDLKASEKATEFSYTIDGMNLNDKQREVAKDCFAYYSMVPAGGKNEDSTWNLKYDRFVSAGIDRDLSLSLTKELDALEPQDGKKTVSAVQKYRVVINSDLTAEEQDAAFQVLMSTDEYAKYSRGRKLGVSSTAYVLYKENMSAFDKNGNGSLSNAEIESLIYYISGNGGHPLSGGKNVKFVAMSEAEKAVLWQMMTGSGSLKNNPYRGKQAQRAASEYLRLKNKEKEDKKEN